MLLSERAADRSTSLLRTLRLPFASMPSLKIHLGEHDGDAILYDCGQVLFDPDRGGFSALEVHETDAYEAMRDLYLHLGFIDESSQARRRRPSIGPAARHEPRLGRRRAAGGRIRMDREARR